MTDHALLHEALESRDRGAAGGFLYGVKSTRIVCRFGCPSPAPKRENRVFFPDLQSAKNGGYRPCLRCRPDEEAEPLVDELMGLLRSEPDVVWSEALLKERGYCPRRVRRAFLRTHGRSFLDMARRQRVVAGSSARQGGEKTIEAQLSAGFESASGFREAVTKLLGRSLKEVSRPSPLGLTFIPTPLGDMIAATTEEALYLLEFADRPELPKELRSVETDAGHTLSLQRNKGTEAVEREVAAYFAGDLNAFAQMPVRYGTAFTSSVHDALCTIPPGTTISYKELAEKISRPGAFRAVARANAANRLAIIVPCHRVIASGGKVSGYAGGVWRKEWLLEHEKRYAEGC
ncbi:bifunctional transcriptional activator/DNA repair enzyme AdaA [Parvularcula maris]|uniref:methylated-DNA--[protein]-cysteine S-methyltransferase n=1 Tax=Parvularcula maris TaxID=2965077 RepID=A0A9X2L6K2_9PROT|nr:methylated-DNA--[protein]-cysteine S-methyltransferase [Parvularcula maris]MCQ8183981.1 methylated-DNA--[protein]-cysteine S-methyltransferase [Parvularcula maris]